MSLGLDHIGVGVADPEAAIAFYATLGFDVVAFDYSGPLPGLDRVAGRPDVQARVVMLRSGNETPLGMASVKLVHVTDEPVPPMPEGMAWGERGVCEVCVHVRGQAALYRRLVGEHGIAGIMEPNESPLPPHETRCGLSYVVDPDGTKVELIEWLDLQQGWPGSDGPQGVNHVAFGVEDIEVTRSFYRRLGFTSHLFESDGHFAPMDPWYPYAPPRQKMMLLTNPHGGGMEPVQHFPPSPDKRGDFGHRGPMDFGIGVRNLDRAVDELSGQGVEFLCAPHTIDVGSGRWGYAYFVDPDRNHVCLTEARY